MSTGKLRLSALNRSDRAGFVAACGPLFEHSPWIAERTWAKRPFPSLDALHDALLESVRDASDDERLALIAAHPDLVGRLAAGGGAPHPAGGAGAAAAGAGGAPHPAGGATSPGGGASNLTRESAAEQRAAGLDSVSAEEAKLFERYNRAYRERFGFPFVICARENRKEAILAAFPLRLAHTRGEEIAAALVEIGKIARLRLLDAISEE